TDGIIYARQFSDDDRLPPTFGQSLGHDTGHSVGHAASRNRDDELDRGARIGLGMRAAIRSREQQRGEHGARSSTSASSLPYRLARRRFFAVRSPLEGKNRPARRPRQPDEPGVPLRSNAGVKARSAL